MIWRAATLALLLAVVLVTVAKASGPVAMVPACPTSIYVVGGTGCPIW